MKEFTTIEKLQMRVSASYGAVLKFGDHVLVTDCHYKGGFTANIYEFIDTPEETGLAAIECRLNHIEHAEQTFEDNGHAIEWCMERIARA